MDFPIVDLLDDELAISWLLKQFHPDGLKCPHCEASVEEARHFRTNQKSQLVVYRCNHCQGIYNLYSGTIFAGRSLRPAQAILLLRGVCKGEPSAAIAREIDLTRQTVLSIRRAIQNNAEKIQPQTALEDQSTETDEMFQNAGEKKHTSSRPEGSSKKTSQQTKGPRYLRERSPTDCWYNRTREWPSSLAHGLSYR